MNSGGLSPSFESTICSPWPRAWSLRIVALNLCVGPFFLRLRWCVFVCVCVYVWTHTTPQPLAAVYRATVVLGEPFVFFFLDLFFIKTTHVFRLQLSDRSRVSSSVCKFTCINAKYISHAEHKHKAVVLELHSSNNIISIHFPCAKLLLISKSVEVTIT